MDCTKRKELTYPPCQQLESRSIVSSQYYENFTSNNIYIYLRHHNQHTIKFKTIPNICLYLQQLNQFK